MVKSTQAKKSAKTTKTTKMASSMIEELYQMIQGELYVELPNRLDPDSGVEWEQLPKIHRIIGGNSDIHVTHFFNRQYKIKPTGMFKLFNKYCDAEPDQIRENLIQFIYDKHKEVKKCVVNCLPAKVSLGNWIICMTHKRNPGDELALFLLCKMFNKHAVIITKSGLWTTLETNSNEGEM